MDSSKNQDGMTHKLMYVRLLSSALSCAANICLAVFLWDYDCGPTLAGKIMSTIGASAAFFSMFFNALGHIFALPPFLGSAYTKELLAVLSSVLFYASAVAAYASRFDEECLDPTKKHPDGFREAVIALPTVQTMCVAVYAAASKKHSSMMSVAVSVIATLAAICGVVTYYLHGGETMPCEYDGQKLVKTDDNEVYDNTFMGIVWGIFAGSVLMTVGYLFQHRDSNMAAFGFFIASCTGISLITWFTLSLIIVDHEEECPFLLDMDQRELGNVAMYSIIASLALQHVVPISVKGSDYDPVDKQNPQTTINPAFNQNFVSGWHM